MEIDMLSIGMIFWILFIVGLVFYSVGVFRTREFDAPSLFWWVLIFLLGIGTFGSPVK